MMRSDEASRDEPFLLLQSLPPEQRQKVMAAIRPLSPAGRQLSGMERLNTILSVPQAARFIRALAPVELFVVLHDVGLQDGVELLRYSSGTQLQALLDIDCWIRDRFDPEQMERWLDVLLEIGPPALRKFVETLDDSQFVMIFSKVSRVFDVREYEEAEPSLETAEQRKGEASLPSPDGQFVLVVHGGARWLVYLQVLLDWLYAHDLQRARTILQACRWDFPSEVEESSHHWRNARIGEWGFLPYHEAIEVEAPLPRLPAPLATDGGFDQRTEIAAPPTDRPAPAEAVSDGPSTALVGLSSRWQLDGLTPDALLARTLAEADLPANVRRECQAGLTGLMLRQITVQCLQLQDSRSLYDLASRVCRFVNLGLQWMTGQRPERASQVLRTMFPLDLYRIGVTLLERLRRHAKRINKRAGMDRGLDPFEESLADCLRALQQRPPALPAAGASADPSSLPPTPVETYEQMEMAQGILRESESILNLCEVAYGFQPETLLSGQLVPLPPDECLQVRFSALFLTGLANRLLDRAGLSPLLPGDLVQLLDLLFDEERPGTVRPAIRQAVEEQIDRLAAAHGETAAFDPSAAQRFCHQAFERAAAVLGGLPRGKPVDVRFVEQIVLVSPELRRPI